MKYFVVDAFAEHVFGGNPAGVCVLEKAIAPELMQSIAKENNLSETAFVYPEEDHYCLRWFTPADEIDLCGHATLGTAYVISNFVEKDAKIMHFHTKSGVLTVERKGDLFEMDFPSRMPEKIDAVENVADVIGIKPVETHLSRDLIVVLESEKDVKNVQPDFAKMEQLDMGLCVVVTAKGEKEDFVSRCFAPKLGVNEDPVTGSTHSTLIPFWAERLQKQNMVARQLSQRGGVLYCENAGERVKVSGKAVLYMVGELEV